MSPPPRTILITGGNSGIGLATAQRLITHGARVGIVGRRATAVAEAVDRLGPLASGFTADVGTVTDITRLASEVAERFGGLDGLFVNAGLGEFRSLEQTDEAYYDRVMDVNLKGAFFTIQKFAAQLRNPSTIVLNTSVAGVKGFADFSAYSAAKAGLRSLARTLSTELLPRGIRINAVSPGPIDTPIFTKVGLPTEAIAGVHDAMADMVPLKRLGTADEVAAAVDFLLSPASSYIVGVELAIDGGLSHL